MILSDHHIRAALTEGQIVINPAPLDRAIQPASIDLRLGQNFIVPVKSKVLLPFETGREHRLTDDGKSIEYSNLPWVEILPDGFLLAQVMEMVMIGASHVGILHGCSSWARKGIMVHTAGFVDPGWSGYLTLEIKNVGPEKVKLAAGQVICQIAFTVLTSPAQRTYGDTALGSRYQYSDRVGVAREQT